MPRAVANKWETLPIELEYDTFGDKKNPALVLIMGFGAQMVAWDEGFAQMLADRGFFVVRFDNRDVGLSTKLDGVKVDAKGFIETDGQRRTHEPTVFAIGDVAGEPMLAHKASHEGRVAIEAIAGHKAVFEPAAIPAVVFTDPEIAWMGLTETQAKQQGVEYDKAVFPWAASGRALSTGRDEGMTKVLFEKGSRRILGAAIVGVNAGELIAEAVLALEMGADETDIALSIHPHPTLSETLAFAAEMAEGTITDLYVPKK